MLILGIETSCDETAVALVDDARTIRANRVLSQNEAHRPYGGVVPEIAARAHLDHLTPMIRQAMDEAGAGWDDLSGIAATSGPGLIGGLIVGVMAGKAIAAARNLPFIAINHLEAHALTPRLTDGIDFPYLLLLASGGHTQLLLVEGVGHYHRLGGTIDDAAGEAFDKVAKMLALGFPGGPALSRAAEIGNEKRFAFPNPLAGRPGCDFSFSGMKTAARTLIEGLGPEPSPQDRADVAASFQAAMAGIVANRTRRAIVMARDISPDLATMVAAGGVAANTAIRAALQAECARAGLAFAVPPAALCTDNAAMVAWAGIERLSLGLSDGMDFAPRPRWPLAV
jgi:N6-L-threonylcarbamoyladenine synthase